MNINYKCPHCNAYINLEDCLIFSVQSQNGKSGLIALHPELGNYTAQANPAFNFSAGETVEFFCPVCHTSLTSPVHKNLSKIIMIDENEREFTILFSKKAGEKSTYKIIGETMEIFGDDSAEYHDFIRLSMNI
ncbi:MAG: hypothetical protein JXA03_02365 [Bacteroidales bacterium]|nr:hypothetical protein [Bacteroidales bacterium]